MQKKDYQEKSVDFSLAMISMVGFLKVVALKIKIESILWLV